MDNAHEVAALATSIIAVDVETLLDKAEKSIAHGAERERLDAHRELYEGALRFKQAALRFRATMTRIEMNERASERVLAAAVVADDDERR